MMHPGLQALLTEGKFAQQDGIYTAPMPTQTSVQNEERELREKMAAHVFDNYLDTIAKSHSIPVMDREIDKFIDQMPQGALILDIGGCWGWHWRRIPQTRSDIGVLIIDFVRTNLMHAINVLGPLVGTQVVLMHADATALPFPTKPGGVFDGVWTVQTFQHIPDFPNAVNEAHRVLKPGGRFITYSLHNTPFNKFIHKLLDKPYHSEGMVKNTFYLTRANDKQLKTVEYIFDCKADDRYSECFFHPELKLFFSGRLDSAVGRLDALLGDAPFIGR